MLVVFFLLCHLYLVYDNCLEEFPLTWEIEVEVSFFRNDKLDDVVIVTFFVGLFSFFGFF